MFRKNSQAVTSPPNSHFTPQNQPFYPLGSGGLPNPAGFGRLATKKHRVQAVKIASGHQLFSKSASPLPPFVEQQRITTHLDAIETRLHHIDELRRAQLTELTATLRSLFHSHLPTADWKPMSKVAPLVRRETMVEPDQSYPELGVRSFGRGTFHKPSINGFETTKRLFEIHPGDVVFSNVFAWEGAVAVVQPEDQGRVGSHRFLTCVCDPDRLLPEILQFYFLTADGLEKLGQASPGGAGRNRTLGIKRLESIEVPLLPLPLQHRLRHLLHLRSQILAKAESSPVERLLPSILNRILCEPNWV